MGMQRDAAVITRGVWIKGGRRLQGKRIHGVPHRERKDFDTKGIDCCAAGLLRGRHPAID